MNGEVPVIQLDAGHMLSDDFNYANQTEDIRAKDEWLLRAYDQFHVAAANVSPRDLPFLGELMNAKTHKANVKRPPMPDRIVSANAVPASTDRLPFKPYVIEEVRGKRLGSKPIRVGIVGVTEKPAAAGSPTGGYVVSDPIEAVKRVVPELRKKCDLLVVLAYVDREQAKRVGASVPGIDLVLAAHQFPLYNAVDEAGDAVVAYVASQTKWLGEIRLYTSKDAKAPVISNYVHRDVPLDTSIPDDPAAAKLTTDARAAFGPKRPPNPQSRGN